MATTTLPCKFMTLATLVTVAACVTLASCGGGNSSNTGAAGGGGTGSVGGSTPSGTVSNVGPGATSSPQARTDATTTPSGATVTKTLQPGVITFDDQAPVSRIDQQTLKMAPAPQRLVTGSVFTWKDHAYVATGTAGQTDGSTSVAVRDAQLSEVLSDLKVSGAISASDIDPNQLAVGLAPGATAGTTASTKAGDAAAKKLVAFEPCKGALGSDEASQSVTCSVKVKSVEGVQFSFNFGFRDLAIPALNVSLLGGVTGLADMTVTPFIGGTAEVLNEDGKAPEIAGDVPAMRIQAAITHTYGFVQVQMPIAFSYDVPLFKFGIGIEASLPIIKQAVTSPTFTLQTPFANIGTGTVFKAELNNAFIGAKTGVEVVLVKLPIPVIPLFAWGGQASDDRAAAAGVYAKVGWLGKLTGEVASLTSKPCFTYDLRRSYGIQTAASGLGTPVQAMNFSSLQTIGDPMTGQTGDCEAAQGFWSGVARVTSCSVTTPPAVCNFLTYNINVPESATLNFRVGGETLNMRLDQQYGCIGTTVGISPTAGSSFTYSLSSGPPYANETSSTTTFTITSVTPTSMSGTVAITFDRKGYDGQTGQGTATGTWSANKRATSFPKCLPPATGLPRTSNTPSFFCTSLSNDYGCDFQAVIGSGRPNEWLSL